MPETRQKVEVPDRLQVLEKPFLAEVDSVLKRWSRGDEEAYWYLAWRLEKFGPFGVYQTIRTFGEFGWSLADLLERAKVRQTEPLTLETETARRLAEPGRRFVAEFFRELKNAAEPYGDSSL